MKRSVRNCTCGTAAGVVLIGLALGCGQKTEPNSPLPGGSGAVGVVANSSDVPVVVNGPEMTQSVPPPPQVAGSANAVEIVHKMPPVPAHVTSRHKHLHLVKYEDKYWLQDVDHHCYIAARDNSGHFYPACYDTSGSGNVYPLYYDSARDDYYRACSDHDNHYFRCYEDEPDYVYYYDPDPIYSRHGNGWNAECEPEVDAPAYSSDWGASIPLFSAALFLFPSWQSQWWVGGDWSSGGNCFVDISFGRPYFDYYAMPPEYPFVYANTLYASNPGWRTDPGWYQHGRFDQTAYQSGAYRSFSGYGRTAAAGTIASAYEGSRAFHQGNNAAEGASSQVAGGPAHIPSGSFGRSAGAAVGRNGVVANTKSSGIASTHTASETARPPSGSFGRGAAAASTHDRSVGHTPGAARSALVSGIKGVNRTPVRGQKATIAHTRPTAHTKSTTANRSVHTDRTIGGGEQAHSRQITHTAARAGVQRAPNPERAAPRKQSSGHISGGERTHSRQSAASAARPSIRRAHNPNRTPPRAQSSGHNSGGGGQHASGGGGQHSGGGGQHSGGAQHAGGDDHKR